MTKRLLLTIALGSAVAVIAAGAAGSATVDLGGGAKVQVPTGGALPACADLADNDGDARTDLADPGCSGPLDGDEYNPPPAPAGGTGGSGGSGGGSGDGGGGQLGPGAPGAKDPKGDQEAKGRRPRLRPLRPEGPQGRRRPGRGRAREVRVRADPKPRRLAL